MLRGIEEVRSKKMMIAIRIRGVVDVDARSKATLDRLRLRKKFSAALLLEGKEVSGMLDRVQHYIAYGKISKEFVKELLLKRGMLRGNKPVDKNLLSDKFIDEFYDGKRKLSDVGVKPFFRLHPPRGGFKKGARLLYPRGVLGHNKQIEKLLARMI